MTTPLILQIQQAALDSKSSVTDALRRAKLACAKLGLAEFGDWVDRELNGYVDIPVGQLPAYRKLHGRPEVYNPFHGWQPIIFNTSKAADYGSRAAIGMSISAIEESLRDAKSDGSFEFPYSPELAKIILGERQENIHIRLSIAAVADILQKVRTILLEWTLEMEKQGVLGDGLIFSQEDRAKSALATASTITNINIEQVGAFVQNAQSSTVQGGVDSTFNLTQGVRELLGQIERALPMSNLPTSVQQQATEALAELRAAANAPSPDAGRLRRGLQSLQHIFEHATGDLLATGALALIAKLLHSWPG